MKVYVRRWRRETRGYNSEGPYDIDAYNGLTFAHYKEEGVTAHVLQQTRCQTIFLHTTEPGALVVYVEDEVGTKEDV